ncbi:MAG: hypothetical protein M1530_04545 [Candidatus Marsarchaeota archaeon]|nr:hypothetical protein [Candidatus Marsarchaeota archaeon]
MDLKSILVKFVGGLAFSYGLIEALYKLVVLGANSTFSFYTLQILIMAVGLVLLAYDFSGCCTASKAKK